MAKRKKIEVPSLPKGQEDAETTAQIAKRLKISTHTVLEIIHRYYDLGQLHSAHIPGIGVSGHGCIHTVYWLEEK